MKTVLYYNKHTHQWQSVETATFIECWRDFFRGFSFTQLWKASKDACKDDWKTWKQEIRGKFQNKERVEHVLSFHIRKEHYCQMVIQSAFMDVVAATCRCNAVLSILILTYFLLYICAFTFLFEYRRYLAKKADILFSVMES